MREKITGKKRKVKTYLQVLSVTQFTSATTTVRLYALINSDLVNNFFHVFPIEFPLTKLASLMIGTFHTVSLTFPPFPFPPPPCYISNQTSPHNSSI